MTKLYIHRRRLSLCWCLFAAAILAVSAAGRTCESIAALTIPGTTVESAAPDQGYCKVTTVSRPTPDSEIHSEFWLPPPERWNGKFLGTGNGGYSSALDHRTMQLGVRQGYATGGSDTGHHGSDLSFGAGHPDKINDWGFRAVHVMTEAARLLMRSYYGRFSDHSYFVGCSTGGHQALMEAQRFPEDYDGIVAGAPGNNRVRLNIAFLWSWKALHDLSVAKLPMIHDAVIAACDSLDGVKDGIIADPRKCRFDPASLTCCLTPAEAAAVKSVYDGARNPRTREQIYAGWARGSELGWGAYFAGRAEPARLEFWRDWVFHDPAWDPLSFDFDRDVAFADRSMAAIVANSPDLSAFRRRHGKLLMYHGWADPVAPPEETIRYYRTVRSAMGETRDFLRLFMVPGMGHCGGGDGPNEFDALSTLDRWVSDGTPPVSIQASHSTNGKVDRTRPLCPWPEVAVWKGTGSTEDAAQFVCRDPGR